ncbi:winged helix DNA-binding domain-containing protein [Streptomyces noursei]|uniref:winged helix DNA-binding domain-containing protein n=1 Tax=Streptomyces noursei TaxID=1971 RepID=UPI0033177993
MTALPRITPAQRRARLVRHHLLAPRLRATTAEAVAEALVGLHATDPATVFLAAAARMHRPTAAAIDRSLYDAPTGAPALERIRCMRGTMFVVPARLAPAVRSATVRDADGHRAHTMAHLRQTLGWDERRYRAVERAALAALTARGQATAVQLANEVAELREEVITFPGKPYQARQRVGSSILGVLATEGRIRRSRPAGSWTSARFRWAPARPLPDVPVAAARTALARHYLRAFGPVTVDDLKWWTGWRVTDTRKAVAATGAQAVELDGGTGYVLPDDLDDLVATTGGNDRADDGEPAAALLPGLDPTAMGWRHRDWYLDPAHAKALFDRNGNIGPTIWWRGRIVGAWAQHPKGHLNHHLLTDPGAPARAAVREEVARLDAFLDGTRVTPCYRTPLERRLAA